MLLAGKQLASDRKGSAIRGLSRAPKPTKKWRTWVGGGYHSACFRTCFQRVKPPLTFTWCPSQGPPAWPKSLEEDSGSRREKEECREKPPCTILGTWGNWCGRSQPFLPLSLPQLYWHWCCACYGGQFHQLDWIKTHLGH